MRVRAVIANRTDPSVLAEVEVPTHPMGEIIAVHVRRRQPPNDYAEALASAKKAIQSALTRREIGS
jgi:hypothetical protein